MNIIDINLTRTSKGLKVKAKSKFFEEYFQNLGLNTVRGTGLFSDKVFYDIRNRVYLGINLDYSRFISQNRFSNPEPSVSFLTMRGLKDGIEFMVPDIIMNTEQMQKFTKRLDDIVRRLYVDINAETSIELTVVDETITNNE